MEGTCSKNIHKACYKDLYLPSSGLAGSKPGHVLFQYFWAYTVGNKAKGRISKRVFQENKRRQIFRKTNIFYPLIRTRMN